jgi:predicted RNA-binding Zn ribbon-like protein
VIVTVTLNDMTSPSWASHVEDKLAPMPLLVVQAFVDTLDRDLGTDIFAHPDEARAWLADAGLRAAEPGPGFADDLRLAREVRESIRALIGRNTGTEPLTADDLAPLEKVLGQAQPRLEVTADGRARLGPDPRILPAQALADGLLGLLLIIRDAQADGSWDRLKLCGNPDCRWAFYDRSHSRRGAWCDMASCGNRLKNRNLRARRAQAS